MGEQELLTDLAVAERNTKGKRCLEKIYFAEEVRHAFVQNHVETYMDLVRVDMSEALRLRNMAVREHLL